MGADEAAEVVGATPDDVRPSMVPVCSDVGEDGVKGVLASLANSTLKHAELLDAVALFLSAVLLPPPPFQHMPRCHDPSSI